VTKLKDKQTRS